VQAILVVGIVIFTGFVFGEIAAKVKLPKVTGYILAGILLNPGLFNFIPQDFVDHTSLITNISLSFITFSVGGTLLYSRIRKLGKGILCITMCEAELTFLAIVIGFLAITPFLIHPAGATWFTTFIPLSLLIGSLGSPTDPAATLAVAHEYKAKGDVSSTIMGVAALDDVTGIINYSVAIAIAGIFILHQSFNLYSSVLNPLVVIVGAIILGIAFGFLFNLITLFVRRETEGVFIVLILALLALCFGMAALLGFDELLATMTMGVTVVNYNPWRDKIFKILQRYTEQLIFVLFFTLSGMHLKFSVLSTYYILVLLFIIFRAVGKVSGTMLGASISKSSTMVKKYAAGGLIPQGGIVIGLALLIKQNPAFDGISDIIINVILGATIVHEIIGPILAKIALKKAGEIKESNK
jgi:Kef-type K+ transport system membrane component KefB